MTDDKLYKLIEAHVHDVFDAAFNSGTDRFIQGQHLRLMRLVAIEDSTKAIMKTIDQRYG